MNSGKRELLLVLFLMSVIMIFCVIAVVIFVRVWRKEHRTDKNK